MTSDKKLDPVAQFLSHAMRDTDKSNREVAIALGYDEKRANFISMMRLGQAKVPLDKVPALAEAIGCDARALMRVCLETYAPSTLKAIESVWHSSGLLTDSERKVVQVMRKEAGKDDLPLEESDLELVREALKPAVDRYRKHKKLASKREYDHSKREWRVPNLKPAAA